MFLDGVKRLFKRRSRPFFNINLVQIEETDVPPETKLRMVAAGLAKEATVIYINHYIGEQLVNLYLLGADVFVPQTFSDVYSIPIMHNGELIGQIGVAQLTNNKIPEELMNIVRYLGELIHKMESI